MAKELIKLREHRCRLLIPEEWIDEHPEAVVEFFEFHKMIVVGAQPIYGSRAIEYFVLSESFDKQEERFATPFANLKTHIEVHEFKRDGETKFIRRVLVRIRIIGISEEFPKNEQSEQVIVHPAEDIIDWDAKEPWKISNNG